MRLRQLWPSQYLPQQLLLRAVDAQWTLPASQLPALPDGGPHQGSLDDPSSLLLRIACCQYGIAEGLPSRTLTAW